MLKLFVPAVSINALDVTANYFFPVQLFNKKFANCCLLVRLPKIYYGRKDG